MHEQIIQSWVEEAHWLEHYSKTYFWMICALFPPEAGPQP